MPKILISILMIFAAISAGIFVLVRYLEAIGIFFPSRDMAVNPPVMGLPWEDVYFKSKDNVTVNGWFFKNPHAKSTLLFAHGNAGNMSDRLFKIKFFYDLGLNIFIFDYRGYGKSEGKPSEAGIYLDAQGAYDYLRSRGDVNMSNIILYGASLGGAVVIDLATQRNAAFLVVESSITNAQDMAKILYPFLPSFFLSLKFNSIDKVRQMSVPKLFIHSLEDQVVPYWVGEKLYLAAGEPKEFLKIHGGHNDGSISNDPSAAAEFIRLLKRKDLL
ncbi:MAG: alpha/beta hydrolase [Candidatus Omnitrophica bacterium]|nr:alpha/beta hydrolase [Candidatus Omnitrophota bacterium]